jgi:hypothetical protein
MCIVKISLYVSPSQRFSGKSSLNFKRLNSDGLFYKHVFHQDQAALNFQPEVSETFQRSTLELTFFFFLLEQR